MVFHATRSEDALRDILRNGFDEDYDLITDYNYGLVNAGMVTKPGIIHILGSQADLRKFREYVNSLLVFSAELLIYK